MAGRSKSRKSKPHLPAEAEHVATAERRALVTILVASGCDPKPLAKRFGLTMAKFEQLYAEELEYGTLDATAAVSKALFEAATLEGNVQAMVFWLKARAGWRDTKHIEVSDVAGVLHAPLTSSPDEWGEIARKQQDILRGAASKNDAGKRTH